ncbi:MAG TPA: hypothetical protein VK728_09670 [Candidatus Sulfotelmatobacter sp.]|nr:hypothetical protein [Candidatus Sulfotelmatobacter sp.]
MPRIKDSISRWLSEIQKAIKEHTEAAKKNQQANARERQQQAQSEAKTVVRLPVEVTEYYRSEQSDRPIQNRRDGIRLWLEIIGVIVGLAIAAFTLGSLFIFDGQLKEMKRQTEISERPWLSIEPKPIWLNWVDNPTGKQPVLVLRLSVKNVGKSIAKDIQIDAKMFPTKAGMPVALDAMKNQQQLCNRPVPAQIGRFDLFPMAEPAEREMDISTLPPAIQGQAVSAIDNKSRIFVGFYFVGCITYHSSFGNEMRQTFFAYHLIGPAVKAGDGKSLALSNGMFAMVDFEVGVALKKEQLGLIQELFARNDAY